VATEAAPSLCASGFSFNSTKIRKNRCHCENVEGFGTGCVALLPGGLQIGLKTGHPNAGLKIVAGSTAANGRSSAESDNNIRLTVQAREPSMVPIKNSERRLIKIVGTDQDGLPTEQFIREPRGMRVRVFLARILPPWLARMFCLTSFNRMVKRQKMFSRAKIAGHLIAPQ